MVKARTESFGILPETPDTGVGNIMMDQFIWGEVFPRISPEAPVPVEK